MKCWRSWESEVVRYIKHLWDKWLYFPSRIISGIKWDNVTTTMFLINISNKYLEEFSTLYCDPHSQRLWHSQKAEIDVFLDLFFFFKDPADVCNFFSGSSAFSKTSLNIWKFTVHVLLKPAWRILSITLLACEMSAIVQ